MTLVRAVRFSLAVLVIALPVLVAVLMLQVRFKAGFEKLSPVWTDELMYWHQSLTFKEAGFNGGFYTALEVPAPIPFTRFYSWGPAIPAFYGTFAKLFGWYPMSIPVINLLMLTLALACFVLFMRLSIVQLLFTGVIVAVFPAFILFSTSSMVTLLELSFAPVAAAGFAVVIRKREQTSPALLALLTCFLILISTMRVTWIFLVLPLFIMTLPRKSWLRVALTILAALVIIVVSSGFYQFTSAYYPGAFSQVMDNMFQSPGTAFAILVRQMNVNLFGIVSGDLVEIHQRIIYIVFMAGLFIGMGVLARKRELNGENTTRLWEMSLHLFNLLSIFIFTLIFYDIIDWRDYRLLAPRLLFSLLLFVAFNRRVFLVGWLVALLIALPFTGRLYESWTKLYLEPDRSAEYPYWREQLKPIIKFYPRMRNPWCNTVLFSMHYFITQVPMLMSIDAGIGLSSSLNMPEAKLPFRSLYLMLDDKYFERIRPRLRVKRLLPLPQGWLYLNLDARCPPLRRGRYPHPG